MSRRPVVERWGLRLFSFALRALPRWLREEVGPSMVETFSRRQSEARLSGRGAVLHLWGREFAGLVRTAVRGRLPDRWSRRTAPSASPARPAPPRTRLLDGVRMDAHFAFRSFVRRPSVALLSVFTLALGIGASTAMFSVVDSVLLRPLPYPEPDRLAAVYPAWPNLRGHPTLGQFAERGTWSWPEFWLVRERQTSFEKLAAYESRSMTLRGDGRPERVSVAVASRDLFEMLGARPRLGRLFSPSDPPVHVALLSHGYWQERFGGDPEVVGRTLNLDGMSIEIVGVLEDGFGLSDARASVWLPQDGSSTDAGVGNHGGTRAIGRLADGVTFERARAEVARILQVGLPPEHGRHDASVFPRQLDETHTVRPILELMLAAAFLLLLVACGNVAALLLGAGIDRERELVVRGALGADRRRIARQLLTESSLLALLGGAAGVGLALLATRSLAFLAPAGVLGIRGAALDPSVLAFALALAALCGIGAGTLPAMGLSGVELAPSMGSLRTTWTRRARLQSGIVVSEIALATVLLVAGTLLSRTVSALNRVESGFDHRELLTVLIAPPYERFDNSDREAEQAVTDAYFQEMFDALESLPGVTAVAVTDVPPFTGYRGNNDVTPEGWTDLENRPLAERRFVSADFFEATGVPIVAGRGFEAADEAEGSTVAVVISRGLADLAWPDGSAVGRTLAFWNVEARVVGVAANVRDEELDRETELAFYAPARRMGGLQGQFLVRASGDPTALIPSVRDRIWEVDPDVPILRTAPVTELMYGQAADQRYRARLMMVFAVLAGVFAVLGIYGVTSRAVARRTREMGIRLALGSGVGRVLGLVTGQAVRLAAGGVVVGLAVALVGGGVIESLLWGVDASDPLTLSLVGLLLPLFAAAAALPAARRAMRVDPSEALRAD